MRNVITNTLEKCVVCNRCIRDCPIPEANIARKVDGKMVIQIDNSKCITCGMCLINCCHDARHYEDDTERFFADLQNGVPISLFAAPAAKTNFDQWGRMFSWLRGIGVRKIYDVSLGADICTWAHIRYIQKNGPKPMITQPCPAIVNYILIHKNELLRYLSPVHSPMLCTAIFMRNYCGVKEKIAALSPCVAKTHEFEATGLVEYNVTLKNLLDYIEKKGVVFPHQSSGFDNYEAGLGSLFPMPGGLKENVEYYVGKSIRVDKSEGQKTVYKALNEYAGQPKSNLPVLFDVLNCVEGCNMGTGCRGDKDIFEVNTAMDNLRQSAIGSEDSKKYLDELYMKFDKTLRLEDFYRKYVPAPVKSIPISQKDIDDAFVGLEKFDHTAMNFNCGACGNKTCLDMAKKIAKGINVTANCIQKLHLDVLKDQKNAQADLQSFDSVLADTSLIRDMVESIVSNIGDITESITAYNGMIREIEKIAMQVKMIATNASIEAARAGEHGKAFSVVAGEIRNLAQKSTASAAATKEASIKATEAIDTVNEMMTKINERVHASYENVSEISKKTKELLDANKTKTISVVIPQQKKEF